MLVDNVAHRQSGEAHIPKLDLKKEHRHLFNPSAKQVVEVEVPSLKYLTVDGQGDPGGDEYMRAMTTLYSLAYTIKFALKPDFDFVVGPLEGLWWDDTPGGFNVENRSAWKWKSMIVQPDFVTEGHFAAAGTELVSKGKDVPSLDSAQLEVLEEGRCVQIMHIGPYADEEPTIQGLHDYMEEHGLTHRGRHHEIYLSDPRRTAPEKLRTVIRIPVS